MYANTLLIIELAISKLEHYYNWVISEFNRLRLLIETGTGPWICIKQDIYCIHHQSGFSFVGDMMWEKIGLKWYLKVDFEMFKDDMLQLGLYVNGSKCSPLVFRDELIDQIEKHGIEGFSLGAGIGYRQPFISYRVPLDNSKIKRKQKSDDPYELVLNVNPFADKTFAERVSRGVKVLEQLNPVLKSTIKELEQKGLINGSYAGMDCHKTLARQIVNEN
jgi:hypothetical protein